MAKFSVYLYYRGCYSNVIEAESEEEALDKARQEVSNMGNDEFVGFYGADIYENDSEAHKIDE